MSTFPTAIEEIYERVKAIKPKRYAATRNFVDGAVTRLSPYISRGVITTRLVYEQILALDIPWHQAEKLIQELAWRDYWQQVWLAKGAAIATDLKHAQEGVKHYHIPKAILNACTGIEVVDTAIQELYQTGYMHNHMRMYVASICCNIGRSHWLAPAKWLYAHLLDGDLASNHLSWQWVAGTSSNKKYYANQDNINTYFKSTQKNTFLDVPYARFSDLEVPQVLSETAPLSIDSMLPENKQTQVITDQKTLIYNYYNLDPNWCIDENVQRIFLLEPNVFEQHSVATNGINFALALAENIPDIILFIGEFNALLSHISPEHIHYKEHPLNSHYKGTVTARAWLSNVTGYYPSFFAFWKKCKKELRK